MKVFKGRFGFPGRKKCFRISILERQVEGISRAVWMSCQVGGAEEAGQVLKRCLPFGLNIGLKMLYCTCLYQMKGGQSCSEETSLQCLCQTHWLYLVRFQEWFVLSLGGDDLVWIITPLKRVQGTQRRGGSRFFVSTPSSTNNPRLSNSTRNLSLNTETQPLSKKSHKLVSFEPD